MTRNRTQLVIGIVVAVVVLGYLLYYPQNHQETDVKLWTQAMYVGIAAMGLNLLTGYNGQVSLGHGAFFGFGAYMSAFLINQHGWSFLATLPVVAALSFVIGAAVGFPALRVKGLYLALITLGLAVIFPDLIRKAVNEEWLESTGGETLVKVLRADLRPPSWIPSRASAPDQYAYYVTLVFGIVFLVAAWLIIRSRFGRALIAVRDHEAAAETVGINLARVKVSAFAISALYAGVAGSLALLATRLTDATKIGVFQLSILLLIAVVIGGTSTIAGPLIGGWLVVMIQHSIDNFVENPTFAQSFFRGKEVVTPALFGISLILFMYVLPDGLVGGGRRLFRSARGRMRRTPTSAPT